MWQKFKTQWHIRAKRTTVTQGKNPKRLFNTLRDDADWSESYDTCKTLHTITTCRSCFISGRGGEGGKFNFKIVYPELDGSNEWLQKSDPTEADIIEGFEPIRLDYKVDGQKKPWGVLGLCTGKDYALISDTPTTGYWFMCIGCKSSFRNNNTIPGPRVDFKDAVTRVELYVMKN